VQKPCDTPPDKVIDRTSNLPKAITKIMKNDMNERIQKLAKQAGLEGSNGHYEYDWFDPDKFAELIVRECVAQIQPMWNQVKEVGAPPGYDYDTFDLAYNDCMNAIKEHFGIEE
jgi:hypothetical protein